MPVFRFPLGTIKDYHLPLKKTLQFCNEDAAGLRQVCFLKLKSSGLFRQEIRKAIVELLD